MDDKEKIKEAYSVIKKLQNNKEIIKEAREELDVLIRFYDRYVEEGYTIAPNRLETILERLKEIKKTLER